MKPIQFPEWKKILAAAGLPQRQQRCFEITIRWYLSFRRRGRAEVTIASARDFIAWAVEEKKPEQWQLEPWPRKRLRLARLSQEMNLSWFANLTTKTLGLRTTRPRKHSGLF